MGKSQETDIVDEISDNKLVRAFTLAAGVSGMVVGIAAAWICAPNVLAKGSGVVFGGIAGLVVGTLLGRFIGTSLAYDFRTAVEDFKDFTNPDRVSERKRKQRQHEPK